MGSKSSKKYLKSQFKVDSLIGKGGFSKVFKVHMRSNKSKFYAMKQISKYTLVQTKGSSFINERNMLIELSHPFIIKIHFAFQDKYNLYLIVDYFQGGDLRYYLIQKVRFTEWQTKFFICSTILGLEHLQNHNIIHRDIKPENLLLDEFGNLVISDLGIAIKITEKYKGISGTPGYMSPEVMLEGNYSRNCDLFSLGVMGFEIMMGHRPYIGKNKKEIRENLSLKEVQIEKWEVPRNWSFGAADFINRLILKDPVNRLGFLTITEVKRHYWVKNFPWKELAKRELTPPFAPPKGENNFDKEYVYAEEKEDKNTKKLYELWLKSSPVDPFLNFDYDERIEANKTPSTNNNTPVNHYDKNYYQHNNEAGNPDKTNFSIIKINKEKNEMINTNNELKTKFISRVKIIGKNK